MSIKIRGFVVPLGASRVLGVSYNTFEIWDFKTSTLLHTFDAFSDISENMPLETDIYYKTPSFETLILSTDHGITILNLETFEKSEIDIKLKLIVSISDNTFACYFASVQKRKVSHFLKVYEIEGLKLQEKMKKNIGCEINFLLRASNSRLVGLTCTGALIWDFEGNLIKEVDGIEIRREYRAEIISENIVVRYGYDDNACFVKLWNFETGDCLKEFRQSSYLGKTPFGFLIHDQLTEDYEITNYIYAYRCDENFTYLGTIFIDGLRDRLTHVKYLHDNLYAFCFDLKETGFFEIEWECEFVFVNIC